MRFVAIDVETANSKFSSICQVGMVAFEDGKEVSSLSFLVDPAVPFSPMNTRIHGITARDVVGSRRFRDAYGIIREWTHQAHVVSHSHFDRSAIRLACESCSLQPPEWQWLDSARIARQTWPELEKEGYRLSRVAAHLGIRFRHHDALEDARACGLIVSYALERSGRPLTDFSAARLGGEAVKFGRDKLVRTGDGDGALTGETIVFTGELSMGKGRAADMAALAGGNVGESVTKKTTMLVVGERDIQPGWAATSLKHQKAEALIAKGQDIRIVGEEDFLALAAITE